MEWRVAAALALCLVMGGCGLACSIMFIQIFDAVNEKLPKAERFSEDWWYSARLTDLSRQYRRLYPAGRLLYRLHALYVGGWISLVAAAGFIGFPLGGLAWLVCGGGVLLWLHIRMSS